MNDKIKEKIPFNVKDVLEDINSNILWNYITNLQHQISLMEEDIRESKEINGELQQENEMMALCDKIVKEKDKQIQELTNNWNELEEWLKSYIALIDNPDTFEEQTLGDLKEVLEKMKEIKEG